MTAGDLRTTLQRLTGWAPHPAVPHAQTAGPHPGGHIVEELTLDTPTGAIPGTLIRPDTAGRCPAVLYCHAHGGDYRLGRRELLEGSRFLQDPPYGPALAAAGFAALCIDMPGFGDRRDEGTENDIAKALFWDGRSLFGAMLNDLAAAFGYLTTRPDIHPGRIFTLGLSMGAAHAFWLAALEPRLAGTAHLCMLADIGPLIADGTHAKHGFYLTVPGLLRFAEMGDIAGLVAPRPQFACHGGQDHLTPAPARDAALTRLKAAYETDPDALTTALDPNAGHGESAPMRVAVLDFLTRAAAPAQPTIQ
ncbi:dienelactone hydrolase family protein [Psychromarinibacter sp. C21-152]|uniref:Dienelactone hydrolase family protein n=1 Tax=Psychromarinibacter sediminicola TaxID=3033385 RepID=A0AAE3NXL9_9RHOB|nr:dienelactone hydrolase family protein [Psychromarinibacter sediminicola]MDF0602522.1 dienelactone hydrolase family protein [Psychromarinibacter sediminicola]